MGGGDGATEAGAGTRRQSGLSRGGEVARVEVRPPGIRPALAVSQTTPEPQQTPARRKGGEAAAVQGGRSGEGASPRSPPPSPMSLGRRCGVRATFSPSYPVRPAALVRGLVRPGPLTSPPSLLPSAPHVWRRRRPGGGGGASASAVARPLTGPAQPDSGTQLPGGDRGQFGAAGRARREVHVPPRASDSRWGRESRWDFAAGRRGRAPAATDRRKALSLSAVRSARSSAAPELRVPSPGPSEGCTIAERDSAPRGRLGPGLRRTPSPPPPPPPGPAFRVPATPREAGSRARPEGSGLGRV